MFAAVRGFGGGKVGDPVARRMSRQSVFIAAVAFFPVVRRVLAPRSRPCMGMAGVIATAVAVICFAAFFAQAAYSAADTDAVIAAVTIPANNGAVFAAPTATPFGDQAE